MTKCNTERHVSQVVKEELKTSFQSLNTLQCSGRANMLQTYLYDALSAKIAVKNPDREPLFKLFWRELFKWP